MIQLLYPSSCQFSRTLPTTRPVRNWHIHNNSKAGVQRLEGCLVAYLCRHSCSLEKHLTWNWTFPSQSVSVLALAIPLLTVAAYHFPEHRIPDVNGITCRIRHGDTFSMDIVGPIQCEHNANTVGKIGTEIQFQKHLHWKRTEKSVPFELI